VSAHGVERFVDWVFAKSLPVWLDRGVDRESGGFHEKFDETRTAITREGKRAMVQARQIYVFSHAGLLTGLPEPLDAAQQGFRFLTSHYAHPEGGWRLRVTRDGAPLDDTRDLYTQAFVLFGLAWLFQATGGDDDARKQAANTMAFIEAAMRHPAGGYVEALGAGGRPHAGLRRQNPHMHLFEAFLAWHDATGEQEWLERARSMAVLLRDRFIVGNTLREFFNDELHPARDQSEIVEPGHHFEWTWLLHRYRQSVDDPATAEIAATLYGFATAHGVDRASGGILDQVDCHGAPLQTSRRLWPQTEAIKAHITRLETGDGDAGARLEAQIDALLHAHLDGLDPGAWREHVDQAGAPLRRDLPASSLYHLTAAAAELVRAGLAGPLGSAPS
jgi:mannose/cellobiose epimerase-like protein (N-acyl-D-glucosamine 2-epimerase family)